MSLRRTGIRRRTPLKAKTTLSRGGRVSPVSKQRQKVNRSRWRLAADYLGAPCRLRTDVCTGRAEHFHELVGRAQGGSLTDKRNLVPACDACNSWVEDHPMFAQNHGLKVHQAQSMRAEDGKAVPINLSPLSIAADGQRGAA